MRPTHNAAIRRPDLGQAAWEVMTGAPSEGYIGQQVMPYFWVMEHEASYPVIPKEMLFDIMETARNSRGGYNRFGVNFERGYYSTEEHGLEMPIDDRDFALYGGEFAYESTMSRILTQSVLREQEKDIADKIFSATNFTAHNATTAWSTTSSSDPQYDIETGRDSLRSSGIMPNCLIVNYTGYKNLKMADAVLDWVYKQEPEAAKSGKITMSHIMDYLDIKMLLVAGGLYNTAKRNQAASLSDIWGTRYAMLCKVAMAGDPITEPSIGRIVAWNEGASNNELIVERYRDEEVRADILRVRHDSVPTFLASRDSSGTAVSEISKACGYLIDTTAAS